MSDIEPKISSRGMPINIVPRLMTDLLGKDYPGSNPPTQNPYWKTFNPYVEPLLEKEMDLRRFNEL